MKLLTISGLGYNLKVVTQDTQKIREHIQEFLDSDFAPAPFIVGEEEELQDFCKFLLHKWKDLTVQPTMDVASHEGAFQLKW